MRKEYMNRGNAYSKARGTKMKMPFTPGHIKNKKMATKSRIRDPLFAASNMVSLVKPFPYNNKNTRIFYTCEMQMSIVILIKKAAEYQ